MCTVRELRLADHEQLWTAARSAMPGVGVLPVPQSPDEAIALLGEYEVLRATEVGNLFGVTEPDGLLLVGVIALRLTDMMVAEMGVWALQDMHCREATADGVALVTAHGHAEWNLIRLWIDLDELDRFLRRMVVRSGYLVESKSVQSDGHVRIRYSSVGR
jgi:hypothetical protein